MKRILILFLFVFCVAGVSANKVKIGSIYYTLNYYDMTASVAKSPNSDYSGHLYIPNTVQYNGYTYRVISIDDNAFLMCQNLTSISISGNVRNIGKTAFAMCTSLKTVEISYGVTNIGIGAFSLCSELTSINLPNSITSIAASTFGYCLSLRSIYIPNSVTSIGDEAFVICQELRTVIIPNSVTSIGKTVFADCIRLTNLTIPNNVKYIGADAFEGVPNVKYYGSASGSPWGARSINGYVDGYMVYQDNTKKNLLACSSTAEEDIVIPEGVRTIGEKAFWGCEMSSIKIANSVTSIGNRAFLQCRKLAMITIPEKVSVIGESAFSECERLKEIHYPSGLDMTKINAPTSVKLISYNKTTPPQNITPSQPPLLGLIEGSLQLLDASNNQKIDAAENCTIKFNIKNSGKGPANNCEARVKLSGNSYGIKVQTVKLPPIAAGQTYEVKIPITTDINTQDGKVTFSIEVYEPNGWGVAPFDLTVATKAYEAPYLRVVDYNITSLSGKVKKMEPFTLTFNLQNTKYGDAEQVKVKINLPANVFVMDGSAELSYAQIKSGQAVPVKITLAANNNYTLSNIPIAIDVKERYGRFAENKNINIALNANTSSSINIAAKDEPQRERKEIQLAMMTSDVDRNIPKTDIQNKNTFVIIIANENYDQIAKVPFAINDGNSFRQYCLLTLGIPEKNINYQSNATVGKIQAQLDWIRLRAEVIDKPNIIIYYAGHGIPDEGSKSAYLIPVDATISNLKTCIKLDDLYSELGNLPTGNITIFMDACFSGSKREQGMLTSARGVALKARPGEPKGNMVVFSAAQGDETAYPYTSQQHGMFTYYLLKKLQDTKGDVTLQDLGNYITSEVKKQSILENNKSQTPCVTPATAVADTWKNWKLK